MKYWAILIVLIAFARQCNNGSGGLVLSPEQSTHLTQPPVSASQSDLLTQPPMCASQSDLSTQPPVSASQSDLSTQPPVSASQSDLQTQPSVTDLDIIHKGNKIAIVYGPM